MAEKHDLWAAFKSGEEEAFSRLFFDHYSRLYHYGLKLAPDEELVKDVIQDFYLSLFENRQSLADEIGNLASYLLVSFRRRLLREINRRRTEQNRREEEHSPEGHLFVIGIEDIVIKEENREQNKQIVIRLLNELPPLQREILYLKYYLDLSLPEIADTLSVSYQVVANHLYRALKKLRGSGEARKYANRNFWFLFV